VTIDRLNDGNVRLTLTADEVRYLRLALERATFLDTPPQHQREIYNFADALLQSLKNEGDPPPSP
jgi:hypothetical protein